MTAEIRSLFPALASEPYRVTSPKTPTYNCIAHAAGDPSRWWWPDRFGLGYWPPGVPRALRLPAFQRAFESLGYRLASNAEFEDGVEKVAIFAKGAEPTHAALQLNTGRWSSKLGRIEDISHALSALEGHLYGDVAFVMKRQR